MAKFAAVTPLDQFFLSQPVSTGDGVCVKVETQRAIVQVFAAKKKISTLERTLKIKSTPGKSSRGTVYDAIPLSPGQWMIISLSNAGIEFGEMLAGKLKKNGYVSEQSSGRVIFTISGPRARELMNKTCSLDLHPDKTGNGWCAQTQMAQTGVIVHQSNDKPVYDIVVYSGFARHFAEWLAHSGAQLGIGFSH